MADVAFYNNDTINVVNISMGDEFSWGNFNVNNIPESLFSKAGYRKKQFGNTLVDTNKLGRLLSNVIEESDRSGYPFATIKLDSVMVSNNHISAIVKYLSGPQIKYASLLTMGNEFVKESYLESYLEIREGSLFDSRKIDVIGRKINNLTYCKLNSTPEIKFENKSCKVSMNISRIKANRIDAMIGFAPNQLDGNKLLATGYLNLDLHNLFKAGKRLTFNWRQFGQQSQTLNAAYNHTNLFKSVINVRGEINLFKQDTSFLNRIFNLNIGYDNGSYLINFTSNFTSSRLLSNTDAVSVKDVNLVDFNAQYFGVNFIMNEFDYPINPTSGWSMNTSLSMGSKSILKTSFVPAEFYDSLETQLLQGKLFFTSDVAFPISKLFVAYSKGELASITSNGTLFNNDLLRLGGVNSLRGFNELEIYSSSYVMVQVEGRLLLSNNSRLFGFVDWAYSENIVSNNSDTFLGIGGGLLLDAPSGVFQLVYAVGKSPEQSLSLAESKIHFGYVARF